MNPLKRFFIALICLCLSAPALAGSLPTHVATMLIAETQSPAPGHKITLAFAMRPAEGWHGYWQNPGDAGFGMKVDWQLPKGVHAGPLRYPVPQTLIIHGLMNYVYEAPYAVLVDFDVDASIAVGTALPIKARADWLACTREICVPEHSDLSVDLIAGSGAINPQQQTIFDGYRAALPTQLDSKAHYAIAGKSIELAIPFPARAALADPYYFPISDGIFDYPAPQSVRRSGDWLIIHTAILANTDKPLLGLLRFGKDQGLLVDAIPGNVPHGGELISTTPTGDAQNGNLGFATIMGLALLGGLILNLMPCVFPILGLKALALAKMGGDGRAAKRDALAYTMGVILSCVALGAILLLLRAAGQQVGWAFQLQQPRVVLGLILLLLAITANLAGIFELGSINIGDDLTRKSGAAGSFWTGVLAAIVATPCAGPFMAAAMGAALLLPALLAVLFFAMLGLGLALPYLAIAFIPRARSLLPKPGPWLNIFRKIMAIPMAITALLLAWLLWRLSGIHGLFIAATTSVFLIGVSLSVGRAQRSGRKLPLLLLALLAIETAASILLLPNEPIQRAIEHDDGLHSQSYTPERLAQYRASGRPVFVYFTADWCVTCKVNEATAIERPATAKAFARAHVAVLVGDYTRPSPELTRALTAYGRSGVPLYVYFPANGEAKILPQLLSEDYLIGLVQERGRGN